MNMFLFRSLSEGFFYALDGAFVPLPSSDAIMIFA